MTDALHHLFNRLRGEGYPAAHLGGIYANKPGYHNKRDQLPGSDYSVQQPDDRAGSGQWAAGLDITMHNPPDMARMTQRLIDLTNAGDPRIQVLREFFGTVNGTVVVGRDVRTNKPVTSDSSHLWHVHLSSFRRFAGDVGAMDALADAILGGSTGGFLMALTDQQQADIYNVLMDMNTRHGIESVRNVDDGAVYVLAPAGWVHVGATVHDYFTNMRMYIGGGPRDITTWQLNEMLATMGGATPAAAASSRYSLPEYRDPDAEFRTTGQRPSPGSTRPPPTTPATRRREVRLERVSAGRRRRRQPTSLPVLGAGARYRRPVPARRRDRPGRLSHRGNRS